ncbi:hypothetical protein JCM21900_003186 [Sporobolomyces salmonicolor]
MASYDTIIIGTGLSALSAARTLSPHGGSIALLEARDRIGGRAHTHPEGAPVDLGCSMIHGVREGNPAKKLVEALKMDVHIAEGAKGLVIGDNGPLSEDEATSLFASSSQTAFKPSPSTPSNASIAALLLPTIQHDPRLVALARTAEIGAGITLEETSAKYAGFERGFAGTDGWPEGGYGEVVKNLVADLKATGGEVHLEEEVVALEDLGAEKGVKVTTRRGTTLIAKAVISTIPLAVLQQRPPTFSPALSAPFLGAIGRTRVGVLEKVVLGYPSAWWPSPSDNGSFLLLPLSAADTTAPPRSLPDLFARTVIPVASFQRLASPPHPTLLAYLGADAGKFISAFPAEEVAAALHDYIVSRLAPASATPVPEPMRQVVTSWLKDPFSLGATSTPVPLAPSSSSGEASTPLDFILLARPEWDGRLGFAGEHTDLDNHGSVAGAVISGVREGERVRGLLERAAETEGK